MIKKFILALILGFFVLALFSQTNPTAQNLPFAFNSQTGSTLPAGIAVHKFAALPTTRTLTPGDADLPYNATQNSGGWNDQGVNGIGILGSGTQSAGALIVSINTTGQTNIAVQWTSRLILQQASRDNSVALQYRIGTTGNFIDVGTTSTFSSAGKVALDNATYTETLPAGAENQSEVQLRWVYWESSSGLTGSRDRIAIDDISITAGPPLPACTEPANQPTNLILTPTPTTVSGNFTAATADEYLVVMHTASTLSSAPVDGTTYIVGNSLGGGTVISIGSGTSFNATGLAPSTSYYFFVFSVNSEACSGGPNYLSTNSLQNNTTTLALPACSTPATLPTNLNLTPGSTYVSGTFTAAADANRYLVVRSTNAALSFAPINGTAYTAGQVINVNDVIVSYGTGTSFTAANLTASTPYYFFVFAANAECTGEPVYNTTSLNENTTTTAGGGTGEPAGYYDGTSGLTGQSLKTALKNIISSTTLGVPVQVLSYTPDVWNLYQYSDMHRNDANTADIIWDMYTDNPTGAEAYTFTYGQAINGGDQCGTYSVEGDCYNREHSMPQSFFAGASPMYSDVHHLFPTDGWVNNLRNNFPFGEVTSATTTSSNGSQLGTGNNYGYAGTVFEPIDAYKGDLARACLYMATRYEDEIINQNWSSNGAADAFFLSTTDEPNAATRKLQVYDIWFLRTMYNWHTQDPVSQKEIDRNNAIYSQVVNGKRQGNRNPFVDHPEFVSAIWGTTLPVTLIDVTATKNSQAIVVSWKVAAETNFKAYEIERSIDGITFIKIGEVQGQHLTNYSFADNYLPATAHTLFYRLKMVDIDNKFGYSKTVSVNLNKPFSNATVYPNPIISGELNIRLPKGLTQNGQLNIMDITGRVLLQQPVAKDQTTIITNVTQLPVGTYFIKIAGNNQIINQTFIKSR